MTSPISNRRTTDRDERDRGSVLVLCLVLILIAGFFVVPLLSYASAILRSQAIVQTKNSRAEAVEGGIRVALVDTNSLYTYCSQFGATQLAYSDLAEPPSAPGLPALESHCARVAVGTTNVPGDQRYALTTTQLQSQLVIPPPDPDNAAHPETNGTISSIWCTTKLLANPEPCGKPYPKNGLTADGGATYDPTGTLWHADQRRASTNDTVFLPYLPAPDSDIQPASGYRIPYGPSCRVFFPGTYVDDVVLTGPDPIYFVSGIYYFEGMLKVTGGASVVVGSGATPGCVDSDSIAALDAVDAGTGAYPNKRQVDGSTGVGGTFVFGALGRLVIDNSVAGDIHFTMNRRVQESSKGESIMNDVSIISVDGVTSAGVTAPYHRETVPGTVELDVPASQVFTNDPLANREPAYFDYTSSRLISQAPATTTCSSTVLPAATATSACPIVDIDLTSAATVEVDIPGYVAVAMGSLFVQATTPADKDVSFGGGILVAQVGVGPAPSIPAKLQLGLVQAIVQQTFKVVSETTSGSPTLRATAIVQVNQTGGYAINSYTVEQI